MILQCLLNILLSFAWKVMICYTKAYLFKVDIWNFFKWQKCKGKDVNWAIAKGLC